MIVLFAFAITPKKFLHDAITNHEHKQLNYSSNTKTHQISSVGFNCQIDNLVVEQVFSNDITLFYFCSPHFFIAHHQHYRNNFLCKAIAVVQLRGPPFNS